MEWSTRLRFTSRRLRPKGRCAFWSAMVTPYRIRHGAPLLGRKLDLPSTIALLNKQHVNNRVYVSLLEGDPEAMVGDKVMPTLPLSVMNVMDGMRGTQDMVVLGESSVNETSSQALDYVVSGAQVLTITVR